MRVIAGALVAVITVLACSGTDNQSVQPIVRDSAGVQIVENGDVSRLPVLQVSQTDLRLDLGSAGDDTTQLLYEVEGAHVLSDGRVVVANRGSHELRYYAGDGRFLYAAGRQGAGPGEFEYLAWSVRCGSDTILTYDIAHRRAQIFDAEGGFARGMRGELPGGRTPYGSPQCWNGTFSVLTWPQGGIELGYHRPAQPLLTVDAEWNLIAEIDTLPGTERWDHPRGSSPAYFGKTPAHAIGPDGIYAGSGDVPELRRFTPEGRLLGIARWRGVSVALTNVHIGRLREIELARRPGPTTERALAETPYPDSLPAYQRFLMSLAGELWVQDYQSPGDSVQWWTVFAGDGRALRRVELPPGFYAFEIGGDYVAGRWRDALDVEHVRVYGLDDDSRGGATTSGV